MKIEFRASSPKDAATVAALCRRVLAVPRGSPMFDEPLLRWKYWQPWATWQGSRSYVLQRGDQLLAHCAVMPLVFEREGRELTLLYPFDWAAEPSAVGSGAALLECVGGLADGLVMVGGSSTALYLAGPLGFRSLEPVTRFAALPEDADGSDLTGISVRRLERVPNPTTREPVPRDETVLVEYPAAVLNEWLTCPAASIEYHEVCSGGSVLGALLVARVPGQTRILEHWSFSAEVADLATLLRAARRLPGGAPGSVELVAIANTALEREALTLAGFQACGTLCMSVSASANVIPEGSGIRYHLLHGDMGFLHHGTDERWSEA